MTNKMKIILTFGNRTNSLKLPQEFTVSQLKKFAADLFKVDITRLMLFHEGTAISSLVSDDTTLSVLGQAGGILSKSPIIQIKLKSSEKDFERLYELLKKQKVEFLKLRQAKEFIEKQTNLKTEEIKKMYKVLMMIAKDFANQDIINIDTLVEDLATRCQKMKGKIRDLKDSIRYFIDKILRELDKHVKKEGLLRNELNEIKKDVELAYELTINMKILKERGKYKASKNAKNSFLKIAGRHYKKIIDRISSLIHRTAEHEKTIDPSKMKKDLMDLNAMKHDKRTLREQQKQIMLEFVKFLIKYQMMRNMNVKGCSGRRGENFNTVTD